MVVDDVAPLLPRWRFRNTGSRLVAPTTSKIEIGSLQSGLRLIWPVMLLLLALLVICGSEIHLELVELTAA